VSALDPSWIAGQRWFRAKQRSVASVAEHDRATVGNADLRVLEVGYLDGGRPDRYFVPTIDGHEPVDGEGAWSALVAAIADAAELPARHGSFTCARTDALATLLSRDRVERRLRVEQSNTSVVIGERLILKLYRLLEPGENPEVEIGTFLTDAGFADSPALAGTITYRPHDGEPCAAAMLTELVPAHGDAWALMGAALRSDPPAGIGHAAKIGRLTGDLHQALRSRPDRVDFPARAASVSETATWRASAEQQLAGAVSAVSGEDHDRLVAMAPAVRARLADAFGSASGSTPVSRIHGDYHLGQLLARTDGGFSVIDFEGEPARPLAERRLAGSPLRDVAGMMRSFDYAARTAQVETDLDADEWLGRARAAFLEAYGGIGQGEGALLRAFELEKACYEVRYEASNRPDWLWLPLAAVERLARGTGDAFTTVA
jgi:predicted trehalose synthase